MTGAHDISTNSRGFPSSVAGFEVVILAAGMGTRLGRPFPKPLTTLANGKSILRQQLDAVYRVLGDKTRVLVVVGFKMDLLMEAAPGVLFVYNEDYDRTNTSKSLYKALRSSYENGVLWMNGDVVFDDGLLQRAKPLLGSDRSFVCVNRAQVGAEEIKYTLDGGGYIKELSKQVQGGLGEAVGINFVSSTDKETLIDYLDRCDEQDYFERAIETAASERRLRFRPLDITEHFAVEIDFEADLQRANTGI